VSFVHLHAHTNFSFGVRFYQACEEAGVKPIVGVELTVEPAVGRDGRCGGRTRRAPQARPAPRPQPAHASSRSVRHLDPAGH
jgi:DNA polymerase III alpha subunit